jgi:anti-sigma factor RsiW
MTIDCQEFMDRLDGFLDGKLSGATREAVHEHLRRCADCRRMAAIAGGDDRGDAGAGAPADLASAVLEQTSGSTCRSARARLCDYVDGGVEAIEGELLEVHTTSCPTCAGLVQALTRMPADLALLAELDPGPAFTAGVVAATIPRRIRAVPPASRLAESLQRLFERPRFAFEGAYIGTFVLVLIFGTPNSPLAGVPRKALELAAANPVMELKEPAVRLESQVSGSLKTAWQTTSAQVTNTSRKVSEDVAERSTTTLEKVRGRLADLWSTLTSGTDEQPDEDSESTRSPAGEDPSDGDER